MDKFHICDIFHLKKTVDFLKKLIKNSTILFA
jgi:hypothetical protein